MEFSQIAILLVLAAVFGLISRILKQPLLIGYLFAGLALSVFGVLTNVETFFGLGQIGVTLLLFLVGLEMKLSFVPSIGKTALVAGLGQIVFTSVIGYFISLALGFAPQPAIYIAIALTFSSTIIMVKLLSEKNDLASLYGRIAIGILLVQDLVAMLILMFLSGVKTGGLGASGYIFIAVKAALLIFLTLFLSKKILPSLFEKLVSQSSELLFVVSISWALGVAVLVAGPLGFTLEIGGFLAGLALSNLPEHIQIASRTRPLRDFFLTIFFVSLGTKLAVGDLGSVLAPGILLALFVLVGNPLIVLMIMGFLGYKKRTAFFTGLSVAQISEFSLILMTVGLSLGHVSETHVALVVFVGIATMVISTYLVLGADKIYSVIGKHLGIFEKTRPIKEIFFESEKAPSDHIILVGCDRTGKKILPTLRKLNVPFLVVDFNPKVVKNLVADKIPAVFGDVNDSEVLERLNIAKAKMVISTTSSLSDNIALLEYIKLLPRKPLSLFTARARLDAIKLYEHKASYVLVPDAVAGEYIKHLISVYGISLTRFEDMGKRNFRSLVEQK